MQNQDTGTEPYIKRDKMFDIKKLEQDVLRNVDVNFIF